MRTAGILSLLVVALVHVHGQLLSDNDSSSTESADETVDILWDEWGVPHIFGETIESSMYALGYAQARSHGNLIMELYAEAAGRSAELFGVGDYRYRVDIDTQTWADEIPVTAARLYEDVDDESRDWYEALAAGFNDYTTENPTEFDAVMMRVLPVSGLHVFRHVYRALSLFTFLGSKPDLLGSTLLDVSDDFRATHETDTVHYSAFVDYDSLFTTGRVPPEARDALGSNVWAIRAPKADAKGAKFIINPHSLYSGIFLWYEVGLCIEEIDVNAHGATFVGFPLLSVGFTDDIGWSHTVGVIQPWVNYVVELVDEDHYRFDGEDVAITREEYPFLALEIDGTLTNNSVVVERTVHGPIFSRSDTQALASRWAGQDRANVFRQQVDMLSARDMDEFKDAMSQLQLGFFMTAAASSDGSIFAVDNGWIPERDSGDWDFWSVPVDGSTSDTLYTDILTFDELPQVTNPEGGFVMNSNEPPWTMAVPFLDPDDYPAYVAPEPFMGYRPQISLRLMSENSNITFEQLEELKHSTTYEYARHVLPELIAAVRAFTTDSTLLTAADILEDWDHTLDKDSRGAVLFLTFASIAGDAASLYVNQWSVDHPLTTPNTLAYPVAAVQSLGIAVAAMAANSLDLDVKYGDVFKVFDSNFGLLPGNGGLETFRNLIYLGPGQLPVAGDSYVAIVEFGEDGSRARNLYTPGSGTQSAHIQDQWSLFSQKTLREVRRTRAELETVFERFDKLSFVSGDGDDGDTGDTGDDGDDGGD